MANSEELAIVHVQILLASEYAPPLSLTNRDS
ncbi:hypothetical protein CLBKND_03190 [Methylorubrum aminovorans]